MIRNIMASLGFMPTSDYLARMSEMKSTDRAYKGLQEAFSEQMNESDNLKVKVRTLESKLKEVEETAHTRYEGLREAKQTIAEMRVELDEKAAAIDAREAYIEMRAYVRRIDVRPVAGDGKVQKYELVMTTAVGEPPMMANTVLRSLVASSKNKKLLEAEARGLRIVCRIES